MTNLCILGFAIFVLLFFCVFFVVVFFFRESKVLHFMLIVCLTENSHEMPSFNFFEKIRILYAKLHCKWAFKY